MMMNRSMKLLTAAAEQTGDSKGLIRFYLLALTIPGLFAFSPGRLMWVWLLG